jgi:hypothetical protein
MFRIFEQTPDGMDMGHLNYDVDGVYTKGTLARGPSTDNIMSLTWPVNGRSGWDDNS